VLKLGLSQPLQLEQSEMFDSILSCTVTDIDWDGCNEILFTTFSQELLVYKYSQEALPRKSGNLSEGRSLSQFLSNPRSRSLSRLQGELNGDTSSGLSNKRNLSFPNLSGHGSSIYDEVSEDSFSQSLTETFKELKCEGEETDDIPLYQLAWRQSYPQPIFGVAAVDVTNDGMNEVVVSSMHGLHISQLDFNMGRYRVLQRLEMLREISRLEREISRLTQDQSFT